MLVWNPRWLWEAQGWGYTDLAGVGAVFGGGVGGGVKEVQLQGCLFETQGGFWKAKLLVDTDPAGVGGRVDGGVGGGVGRAQGGLVENKVFIFFTLKLFDGFYF